MTKQQRARCSVIAQGSTQNYVHIDEALSLAVEKVSMKIANLLDGTQTATIRLAA